MRLKKCLGSSEEAGRGRHLAWMAGGVFLAVCLASCASFERLTRVTPEEFPRAELCGECHVEIHKEWSQSPHARAYAETRYREATDGYRFSACLGCHAPEPALTEKPPLARAAFREDGVTCVACHLAEGKMLGPITPTGKVAPHPVSVTPERHRGSGFCGRCHTGTLAEWNAVKMEKKPTCQECHMPAVTRKVTQATSSFSKAIVAMEREMPQKRHTFVSAPTELASPAFTVSVAQDATGITLRVRNNLAHSVPTGDFGFRVALLEAFTVDAKGAVRYLGQRELIKQLGTGLPPQTALEWKLPAAKGARSVLVRIRRLGRESAPAAELFKTEVPL